MCGALVASAATRPRLAGTLLRKSGAIDSRLALSDRAGPKQGINVTGITERNHAISLARHMPLTCDIDGRKFMSNLQTARMLERQEKSRAAAAKGESVSSIARRFSVSRRTIARDIAPDEEPEPFTARCSCGFPRSWRESRSTRVQKIPRCVPCGHNCDESCNDAG